MGNKIISFFIFLSLLLFIFLLLTQSKTWWLISLRFCHDDHIRQEPFWNLWNYQHTLKTHNNVLENIFCLYTTTKQAGYHAASLCSTHLFRFHFLVITRFSTLTCAHSHAHTTYLYHVPAVYGSSEFLWAMYGWLGMAISCVLTVSGCQNQVKRNNYLCTTVSICLLLWF